MVPLRYVIRGRERGGIVASQRSTWYCSCMRPLVLPQEREREVSQWFSLVLFMNASVSITSRRSNNTWRYSVRKRKFGIPRYHGLDHAFAGQQNKAYNIVQAYPSVPATLILPVNSGLTKGLCSSATVLIHAAAGSPDPVRLPNQYSFPGNAFPSQA